MKLLSLLLTALFSFGPIAAEEVGSSADGSAQVGVTAQAGERSLAAIPGWTAQRDDCICGISDLRKVSHPAKVDYDALLDATPHVKEMKQDKIDPQSREGRALMSKARTLVARTCEAVQRSKGHCGVWKQISHSDGRSVVDITSAVTAGF
ncbi:MAG: hypothetical protein WD226_09770 [Planctomycetota bacterium]